MNKTIYCLVFLLLDFFTATAQNPYVLNGSATQDNCHCYTLTNEVQFQSGSIWNKNKIDLNKPFDYFFNVYLGCRDDNGADGIAFVLQPISTSLGTTGQGLGFGGIIPSLGVTIDTYSNTDNNDPFYDHVAIQKNGNVTHNTPDDLTGPVMALSGSSNIEDCKWHVLEIDWQPSINTMKVSIDGVLRVTLQKDITASVFSGDPMVYWGFTSATGGSVNVQKMCTSLDANFSLAQHDNTCIGTPLTFLDSSVSFGSITNWSWNFGDGITSSVQNPPPHIYASPGIYNVTLNVTGGDGCRSDTLKQQITVGSYPVADFKTNLSPICTNRDAVFTDETVVDAGTKNYWYWNFGNGKTSNAQNPPPVNYKTGNYNVQLFVKTKEGCASDTVSKNFIVSPAPDIKFDKMDGCKNTPVQFTAQNFTKTIGINEWHWNFGDGSYSSDSSVLHTYLNSGKYDVLLVAQAINGCLSDTITKKTTIYSTNAYAGKDSTILQDYPYQLHASGGNNYVWSPATGLSDPFIANPVATLHNNITYILTASTSVGCATSDTLHLKVVKGPEIYVPSAFTPNGDGRNDRFKIIPVGIARVRLFTIMNRWGQVIYSSQNALEGWDGTMNGIPQPIGTYIWMVTGKAIDNTILEKKGTLVLIR